ncbi:calcium-binding protein, partial [Methylocucumis oryzae]|uniref:calcium-binding protein n=1 Tax=Methylocucumis oryzae TaxID=1632867 RepID=UPI0006967F50
QTFVSVVNIATDDVYHHTTHVGLSLTGDNNANKLSGGQNNDSIRGLDGNDVLYGKAGDDALLGGLGDDTLSGGDGNDTLAGGGGSNVLKGGQGNDSFVFYDINNAQIADFSVKHDTIMLSSWLVDLTGLGTLSPDKFIIGNSVPDDLNIYIIYDDTTGGLYYGGLTENTLIATLGTHLALTHENFIVI